MNKTTRALSDSEYREIIATMRAGFSGFRPNDRAATALIIEASLGIRVSDVVRLRLADIIRDGERYRLDITEKKTGKRRTFTVPAPLHSWLRDYCHENGIAPTERIIPVTVTSIQKSLRLVCEYLGLEGISTHSLRKYFATQIYQDSGYNIALVSRLLQHSSTAITQRYIGIQPKEVEQALQNHLCIV